MLASVLSLCIHFGFVIGALLMPLYGGQPVGERIIEPEVLKVPLNVLFFSFMFFIQSTVIVLLLKK